jgi:hypothetical protein
MMVGKPPLFGNCSANSQNAGMADYKITGFPTSPEKFSPKSFIDPSQTVFNRQVVNFSHSFGRHENSRFTDSFGFEPTGSGRHTASDPESDDIDLGRQAKLFH